VALFRDGSQKVLIIGSSNVTEKGLSSRGEDNLEIVGEAALYTRLREDILNRLRTAHDAEKLLPEYERNYKKNRWLRVALDRRNGIAAQQLSGTRQLAARAARVDLASTQTLTYCNVTGIEDDRKIKAGAKRHVENAEKSGIDLPDQWIRIPSGERRHYKQGVQFLIADDIHKIIGLAVCKEVAEVLDERSHRAPLVFYRYHRGRRFKLPNETTYRKFRTELRAGDKPVLKRAAVRTVNRILRRLARRKPT